MNPPAKETEMATNKNKRVVRFKLNDDDFRAFGRYRILYTEGGRKLVNRQRLTYLISGLAIAGLFTLFHADHNFTMIAYAVAAVIGIGGPIMSEKILLRQQDKNIQSSVDDVERVHPEENVIIMSDDELVTEAGSDRQTFDYKDIKLVDLTDDAIYVWMSDTMIMPIPLHAFRNMEEMKKAYNWLQAKIKAKGGDATGEQPAEKKEKKSRGGDAAGEKKEGKEKKAAEAKEKKEADVKEKKEAEAKEKKEADVKEKKEAEAKEKTE